MLAGHGIESWGERGLRMMGDEAGERDAVMTWGSKDHPKEICPRCYGQPLAGFWQTSSNVHLKNTLNANWRIIWHGAGRVWVQQSRREKMSLEGIGTSHTLAACPERMQRKQRDEDH